MKVYQYKDYDEYVKTQTEANKEKHNWCFITPRIAQGIIAAQKIVGSIICHGTRAGGEQHLFRKELPYANIVGTEIAEGCEKYPMTVQWDMQEPKKEWIGKFDIVYSNSFDHCIYPEKCLQTWKDQLTPTGSLYIEYSEQQSNGSAHDPLDATMDEVASLMRYSGLVVNVMNGLRGKSNSIILRGKSL